MGLEDLETLERVFSLSNQLASVTRYMTPYRRRAFIDLYFQQWDREKYANLATMLFNNYKQALDIIHEDAEVLAKDLEALGLCEADLEAWWQDQETHFQDLGIESQQDVRGVLYVEQLQKLHDIEQVLLLIFVSVCNDLSTGLPLSQLPLDFLFRHLKIFYFSHPRMPIARVYLKHFERKLSVDIFVNNAIRFFLR